MIVDTMENINFYFGMSQELDQALSVLKNYSLKLLEPGIYEDFPVAGSGITLKVLDADTLEDETIIPWEYHKEHIDLQWVLGGGTEVIGYAPRTRLANWEYNPETDSAITKDICDYLPIRLEDNDFAIFFPQDAHRKIQSYSRTGYKKIVVKIPLDGFIKKHKIKQD